MDLTVEQHTEYNHNRVYLFKKDCVSLIALERLLHHDGGVGLLVLGWMYGYIYSTIS